MHTNPYLNKHYKQLQQAASNFGLPIGNLTSQFFSNVYLNPLDQFVKHQLKCQHYVRYVDDFIFVHQSAEQLYCWQRSIEAFLQQQLQLQLKPQTILRSLNAGADFLGFIVRPYYLLVRRRVLANWGSKLKQWRAGVAHSNGLYRLPPQRLAQLQSVCASYLGHIQQTSYFSLLDKLLAQMPWFQHFHGLNQGKLIPRWQNRKLYRFVAKCRWFLTHYSQHRVWVQKGRHFIDARQPDREYPLLQLHQQLLADRSAARPYAWISEQGYIHRCLKGASKNSDCLVLARKHRAQSRSLQGVNDGWSTRLTTPERKKCIFRVTVKHRQLVQLLWPQDQIIHSQ